MPAAKRVNFVPSMPNNDLVLIFTDEKVDAMSQNASVVTELKIVAIGKFG